MNWPLLITYSQWLILLYFVSMNLAYLTLNLLSLRHIRRYISEGALDALPYP